MNSAISMLEDCVAAATPRKRDIVIYEPRRRRPNWLILL